MRRSMRRMVMLVAAAVATPLLPAAPALAATNPCHTPNPPPWCITTGTSGSSGGSTSDGRPIPPAAFDVVDQPAPDMTNGRCWAIVATTPPGMTWAEAVANRQVRVQEPAIEGALDGGDYDACPGNTVDPAQLAQDFWLGTDIDPPAPTADPGRALVGLKTYLEVGGPGGIDLSDPTGVISISGSPTYTIDWGDGGPTYTTADRGLPYPGGPGEITHVYSNAATVTITVTATWTGTWSVTLPGVGTSTGILPAITRVSSVSLPVDQVQAVREH